MPQLEACQKYDIKVRSFAYPNNLRNEKTDQELFQYFDYLRAGFAKDQLITFTPLAELQNKMVLRGIGIVVEVILRLCKLLTVHLLNLCTDEIGGVMI